MACISFPTCAIPFSYVCIVISSFLHTDCTESTCSMTLCMHHDVTVLFPAPSPSHEMQAPLEEAAAAPGDELQQRLRLLR